MVIILMKNS